MKKSIPTEPGQYYWSEWQTVVTICRMPAFNWRRPRKVTTAKSLCVHPFPGFPHPLKISKRIAGSFTLVEKA